MDNVPIRETWAAMEALVDEGLVKAIGIPHPKNNTRLIQEFLGLSNFDVQDIEEVMSFCRIRPTVNQFETQPYHTRQALIDCCNKHGWLPFSCRSLTRKLTFTRYLI